MINKYLSRQLKLLKQRIDASSNAYRAGTLSLQDLEFDLHLMYENIDNLMIRVLRMKKEEAHESQQRPTL